MEIRARFTLIGLFTLGVILAGFAFVYWLNSAGGFGEKVVYRIRYERTVAGLLKGSAVLFNGIRVGEVGRLDIDPGDPKRVVVTISVEHATPVRADTKAGIEFQGLTGAPVVSLLGGEAGAAPLGQVKGEPPLLIADPDSTQTLTEAAREAVRRISSVMGENAEPFHSLLTNLNTFSAALARNSDRVDGIVSGLERLTGGSAKAKAPIFELSAPVALARIAKVPAGQLAIPEPTALAIFDTDRILIGGVAGAKPAADGPQWPDTLPKVVQARMIESFERAGYGRVVGRAPEGLASEHQLLLDIRSFHAAGASGEAEVSVAAKLVRNDGRIVGAQVFKAGVPARGSEPAAIAGALNEAFGRVVAEVVPWAAALM